MRRLALAAVALLLVAPALLVPVAGADHVFTHRYVVLGRVVDAEGRPVVGQQVDVTVDDPTLVEGLCEAQPGTETDAWGETTTRPTTDEHGEFLYCLHVHAVPRFSDAQVRASVLGAEASDALDARFRTTYLEVRTGAAAGNATEEFEGSYLVSGRVWFPDAPRIIEGISTFGDVLEREPVQIDFVGADGERVTASATTNAYGDFAVRLPVEDVAGGRVEVRVAGETFTETADPVYRATVLDLEVQEPGSRSLLVWGAVVAGIALVVAVLTHRRVRARRERAKGGKRAVGRRTRR